MKIGVSTWSGTYIWEWTWERERLTYADLTFALKADPSRERHVEGVEQLPSDLDGLLECRPDGTVLTIGDEVVQENLIRMANYRFPYRLLVDGEHRYDWVLVYTWAVGTADGDVLAAWALDALPHDGTQVREHIRGELWQPGSVETHGSVEVGGAVELSGGTRFESPLDMAVLAALMGHKEYKAAASLLPRIAEGCHMELDDRSGTIRRLTVNRSLPELFSIADCSSLRDLTLVNLDLDQAAEIRACLTATPDKVVIRGVHGPVIATLFDGRVETVGAVATLEEVRALNGHQVVLRADEWPAREVLQHVLSHGPTVALGHAESVSQGSVRVQPSTAREVLPLESTAPWSLTVERLGKDDADLLDIVGAMLPSLRSVSLRGSKLSGRLPAPTGTLPLQSLSLGDTDLHDADLDAVVAWIEASPSLTSLDISGSEFTGVGVNRLRGLVGKVRADKMRPKPPAEWTAGGLTRDELPEAFTRGQDRKFGGSDFPWDEAAPSLKAAIARAASALAEVARAGTAPMQHKTVVGACDRLVKASAAKNWKTALTRMLSASKKLSPKGHDPATRAFAELVQPLEGSIKLMHAAWILDVGATMDLGEIDWERAQLDFEPQWLLHLSTVLVRIAGCTANWDNVIAPTTHGDPAERQRLLEAWSAL